MRVSKGSVLLILVLLLVGMVLVGPVSGSRTLYVPFTISGQVLNSTDTLTYLNMRDGIYADTVDYAGTTDYTQVTVRTANQNFDYMSRFIVIGDISGMQANGTINVISGSVFLSTSSHRDDWGTNGNATTWYAITNITVANFSQLSNTDYGGVGSDQLSQAIPDTNLANGTNNFNEYILTEEGIATLNLSGYNSWTLRDGYDITGIGPGWMAGCQSYDRVRTNNYGGTAYDPYAKFVYDILPVAGFSADDTTPDVGQAVTFTDASTNDPTSWLWDFGDGETSTDQNPTHIYHSANTFTVTLTSTNTAGSDDEEKSEYITTSTVAPSCPVDLNTMFNVTGDGSEEQDKLQDAFNYTRSVGTCKVTFPKDAVIVINSTHYVPGSSPINMSENIELDGQNATLWLSSSYAEPTHAETIIRTADGVWWHNLNYFGNYPQSMDPYVFDPAMQVSVRNWVVIEESSFWNMSQYGIEAYRKSNWIIRNNYFENCRQYCITTGGGDEDPYSENGTVTGNTIIGANQPAIKIRGTANSTVSFNHIWVPNPGQWGSGTGIRLYSADATNHHINITSNVIEGDYIRTSNDGYAYGIFTDNPENEDCVIHNNTINGTYNGISLNTDNLVVAGNTITNSQYAGIRITKNSSVIEDNIITGNGSIMVGSYQAGVTAIPSNNIIRNNYIEGGGGGLHNTGGVKGDGIFFPYNGTGNILEFNTIVVPRIGFNINSSDMLSTEIRSNVITAGTCIIDLGTTTINDGNNTCNGAMDPVIVKFTGVQTIPSVGKKQVVLTDTSTGPTILSRIWTATEIGNSTPVSIGTTTPLTVILGTGNYSIVLNASAAIEANSTAANTYWVNVSASSTPWNWWPDIHWWWWRLPQPLFPMAG